MSSLAKIPVAVTHRGSAPLGRAIRYYAFSRQRSGRPRATAGAGRIEPPEIEPGRTAGECRTLSNLLPDAAAVSTPSPKIDGPLPRSAGFIRKQHQASEHRLAQFLLIAAQVRASHPRGRRSG